MDLDVIKKVTKYCNSIKIPVILIENKNPVKKDRIKIFKNDIFVFL